MPQLLWLLTAAPRFKIGDRLCGNYKVLAVGMEDKVSQLVYVKKKGDTSKKIVRIITRARVKEKDLEDEIQWLKNTSSFREEFAQCIDHHLDFRYSYIVFEKRPRTLKDVIADLETHISRRHVIEISLQMINAIQYLNNYFIYDIDICPQNFEVVDDETRETYYSRETRRFQSRKVLKSTKIRFAYYGRVGADHFKPRCKEEYKSPEHVYHKSLTPSLQRKRNDTDHPEFPISAASNAFSVGCVMAELLLRKPLFPDCSLGRLYTREKAVVFDTILGPFPDALVRDIRRVYKGVFKYDDSDFPEFEGVSKETKDFCEQAEPLKYLLLEEFAVDVVESLTNLDSTRRIPLHDILHHPFFGVSSL